MRSPRAELTKKINDQIMQRHGIRPILLARTMIAGSVP